MSTPQSAKRDVNRVTTLLGVSNDGSFAPVDIYADPITNRLLVNAVVSGGLSLPTWDYVSNASTSTSDTYSFKVGGSGGTLVATVAVVYTDSTKGTISTVTRT